MGLSGALQTHEGTSETPSGSHVTRQPSDFKPTRVRLKLQEFAAALDSLITSNPRGYV